MRIEINFDIDEDDNRSMRNSGWKPSAKETIWYKCEADIKVKLIYITMENVKWSGLAQDMVK